MNNHDKAYNWFKENGYMPDENEVYDLHHINPSWRLNDPERYNQWNIEDLVVMTHSEHASWHGQHMSEEVKLKISAKLKGRTFSEQRNEKLSQSLIGHEVSEETRQKLRDANLGKINGPHSEETKRKISEANKGEHNGANTHPEKNNFINNNPSTRLLKGTHYYNNGEVEVRAFECPEGFVKGRLPGAVKCAGYNRWKNQGVTNE